MKDKLNDKLNIRIDKELKDSFKLYCKESNTTAGKLIRDFITKELTKKQFKVIDVVEYYI